MTQTQFRLQLSVPLLTVKEKQPPHRCLINLKDFVRADLQLKQMRQLKASDLSAEYKAT